MNTITAFKSDCAVTMPKSYSTDLRWRVVWLHVFMKKSAQEVSQLLLVSTRTVQRYCQKFLSTGGFEPQQHRNGPRSILSDYDELTLVNLVLTRPGIYLYELQRELLMTTGTEADCSTICRLFKRLGITRQKIKHIALQRSEEKRGEFMAEMMMYDSSMLVWCDESGCERRKLIRDRGYGTAFLDDLATYLEQRACAPDQSDIRTRSARRGYWR